MSSRPEADTRYAGSRFAQEPPYGGSTGSSTARNAAPPSYASLVPEGSSGKGAMLGAFLNESPSAGHFTHLNLSGLSSKSSGH
ncbi:hypothetical protein N7532_001626 [Penicillium argentinense]|uniref:Uncharacterized protein n=1 Tax=Penicillium argentinense TaxID=1131581 RepID=A0A9W9KML9_9EURO|nr:uncharacterized protein N7532_001626 [Penicillium argentinense]KAJ5111091.1 hypothetical protein N7532_001626 [Penicillium argentinense]